MRAIIVNSGNANAFTGKRGEQTVQETVDHFKKILLDREGETDELCYARQIYVASTGVIGEPLPSEKLCRHFSTLYENASSDCWHEASQAIMTTDKYAKSATIEAEICGVKVRLNGIAKGAGMIAPDMATMLAFIGVNVPIKSELLQKLLERAVDKSFNSISVDSDMSTSDSVLFFSPSQGNSEQWPILEDENDERFSVVGKLLDQLLQDLALQIVLDGEGARHLLTVRIEGAEDDQAAKKIGFSIINSPLVKTAIAGEDANWGRVVMAVGKSGQKAERDLLSIWFGPYCVASQGERAADYDEKQLSLYMKNKAIVITVDLGLGPGRAQLWGCDLTHDYVSINADYRS